MTTNDRRGSPAGACPDAGTLLLYAAGRPVPGNEQDVERHIGVCATCRGTASGLAGMSDRLRVRPVARGAHPSDEELSLYAAGTHPRPAPVELHLASCLDCLDAVLAARAASVGPVPESVIRRAVAAGSVSAKGSVGRTARNTERTAAHRTASSSRLRRAAGRSEASMSWAPFAAFAAAAAAVLVFIAFNATTGDPDPGTVTKPPVARRTPETPARSPVIVHFPSSVPAEGPERASASRGVPAPGPVVVPTPDIPEIPVEEAPPAVLVEKTPEPPAVTPVPAPPEPPPVATIPPTPDRSTTVAEAPGIAVAAVSGEAWRRPREGGEARLLRAGDRLREGDHVETPFGRHAYLNVGNHEVALHHRTDVEVSLPADAFVLKIAQGELFAVTGKKAERPLLIATSAGLARPEGTQYLVRVEGKNTILAVKEGKVLLEAARTKVHIPAGSFSQCRESGAPANPRGIIDTRTFDASTAILTSGRTPGEPWMLLYPPGTRVAPVVFAAPHVGFEGGVTDLSRDLAETLGAPCIVASGYKNRNIEVSSASRTASAEARQALAEYEERLRLAAPEKGPLPLLVEIHGYITGVAGAPIEVGTSGFDDPTLEKLQSRFAAIAAKHKLGRANRIVFDRLNPTYRVDGREYRFRFSAAPHRTDGVFRPQTVRRGLKMEFPNLPRLTDAEREALQMTLVEWLGEHLGLKNEPPSGCFDGIADGSVFGWAIDRPTTDRPVRVQLWMDGPAGQGTLIGTVKADGLRTDVNQSTGVPGRHGFIWPIPGQYRNGPHRLWIYGLDSWGAPPATLLGSPRDY